MMDKEVLSVNGPQGTTAVLRLQELEAEAEGGHIIVRATPNAMALDAKKKGWVPACKTRKPGSTGDT